MLSIGAFSRLSNVSIKTLRFYHEIGLFAPVHVDRSTGYRYYLARQLSEIGSILALKDMGFSLDEIQALLREAAPARQMRDRLIEKRVEIEGKLNEGREQMRRIDVALSQIETGGEIAAPAVTLKRLPSQLVASIRDTAASYETAASLFDELRDHVKRGGAGGTLGAVWHNCAASGKEIDCEALVLLNKPLTSNKRVRVYELPAATVASAVHHGDADFSNSYMNANKWIASNDLRRNGPNREIYLQGGYSNSDSAVMEIQFPVEPARPPKSG